MSAILPGLCTPDTLRAYRPDFEAGRDVGRENQATLVGRASTFALVDDPWIEALQEAARLELRRRRMLEEP